MIQRRGLLAGLGALLAAPAIIRTPGLLMPTSLWAIDPMWLALVEAPNRLSVVNRPGEADHERRIITTHCGIVKVRQSQIAELGLKPLCAVGYRAPWT